VPLRRKRTGSSTGKWTRWITRNDAPRRDIVAGARYYVQPEGESREFGIAVVDDGRAEEMEDDRATAGPPTHRRE